MKTLHVRLIHLAAAISVFGVLIHVAAIIGGPSWYQFFGAPPQIVDSARAGTLLAPISTTCIALLMGVCAAYAYSALGLLRRLPLMGIMLAGMAAVCILRALVLVPVAFINPQLINLFEIIAAVIWGMAGIGFAAGFIATRPGLAAIRA